MESPALKDGAAPKTGRSVVKNKSLVVAASFAMLLAAGVPSAKADGIDQPWGVTHCALEFVECLVQGALNVL